MMGKQLSFVPEPSRTAKDLWEALCVPTLEDCKVMDQPVNDPCQLNLFSHEAKRKESESSQELPENKR